MSTTVTDMWTTTINHSAGTETNNTFRGTKYTMTAPVKYLDVTRYRTNPNLCWPGNFEDEVWSGSDLNSAYFETINTPTFGKSTETNDYSRASIKFTLAGTKGTQAVAGGVRSIVGESCSENPQSKLAITFKYALVVSDATPIVDCDLPEIGIAFSCGGRYLQDDLSTWEGVENILWFKIPTDRLSSGADNWQQEAIYTGSPYPGGEVFFEVFAPIANGYTITHCKFDEIYVMEYIGANQIDAFTYSDQESVATNNDLASTILDRDELELNIQEFPMIPIYNYANASVESTVIEFGEDSYVGNDYFQIVLDGATKTYTYKVTPGSLGSGEWGYPGPGTPEQIVDRLVQEIYLDTNNYTVVRSETGGFQMITITALQYGDEIGAFTYTNPYGWNDTRTEPVAPTLIGTFVSKACITDNATPDTSFLQKWLFNAGTVPSNNEAKHWEVLARAHLELKSVATERIEGTFYLYNEGTDQFGALTGVDVDGSDNIYFFVSGSLNVKMQELSGVWMKYKPVAISSFSSGEIIPDSPVPHWTKAYWNRYPKVGKVGGKFGRDVDSDRGD